MADIENLKKKYDKLNGFFEEYKKLVAESYEDSYFYANDIEYVKNHFDSAIKIISENFIPALHKIISYSKHYEFKNTTDNFSDILAKLSTDVSFFNTDISAKIEEASKKAFEEAKEEISNLIKHGQINEKTIRTNIDLYYTYDKVVKSKYSIDLSLKTPEEKAEIDSTISRYKNYRARALNNVDSTIPDFFREIDKIYEFLINGMVKGVIDPLSLEKPTL